MTVQAFLLLCFITFTMNFSVFAQSQKKEGNHFVEPLAQINSLQIQVERLFEGPIIYAEAEGFPLQELDNINGPSLIKVPEWIDNSLGKYYLYFAHHHGKYIRLAYADSLQGPWKWVEGGVLPLEDTPVFQGKANEHLASPDVHIDEKRKEIQLYFHQTLPSRIPLIGNQGTFLATSKDGLHFDVQNRVLGHSYFRVFEVSGEKYAFAKNGNTGGVLYRFESEKEGFTKPEEALYLLDNVRHTAVLTCNNTVLLFYSRIGDEPEQILVSEILNSDPDWKKWTISEANEILRPEYAYEGVEYLIKPSESGVAKKPVHELRDPAIFKDHEAIYLLYTVAGEQGIAIAKLRSEIMTIKGC